MRNSPLAIIQGADEIKDKSKKTVQIKDLAKGARLSKDIDDLEEWRAQPAQTLINRADLVAKRLKRFIRTGDLRTKAEIKKDTP